MKYFYSFTIFLFYSFIAFANDVLTEKEKYVYTINLKEIKNDRVMVQLTSPTITKQNAIFYMPKIVPGTYSVADYGQFISDFKAYDKNNKEIKVTQLNVNSWKIEKPKKLTKITYWVDDTFDSNVSTTEIFEPAGTNIEKDTNFILNAAGFFGYFKSLKTLPFEINIIRDVHFYGSTGLQLKHSMKSEMNQDSLAKDTFVVDNYDLLIDSPMMYNLPDTTSLTIANTKVLISCYSPNKLINSKSIAQTIEVILKSQQNYLGGELPVDKYAFIFYFTDQPIMSYGALEHSYSSFYYMPENTIENMNDQLRDFAAHEFFHIITPLNIHSEEIHRFDFNEPKMSQHLWLYEGVTEYFAGNVQVKNNIVSQEEYFNMIREKIFTSKQFIDNVAFTSISKGILDKYEDQYYNVYQKGALIGLCLDIELLSLSEGKYGLQRLIKELAQKYGKDKPFKDDELFDEITKLTYPEIGEFLKQYVGGDKPLPLRETFAKVGVDYFIEKTIKDVDFGFSSEVLSLDMESEKLKIQQDDKLNEFGKAIGFKNGDILSKMNNEEIPSFTSPSISEFLEKQYQAMEIGKDFSYTVIRDGVETVLKTKIFKIEKTDFDVIESNKNANEGQLMLKKNWLTNNG